MALPDPRFIESPSLQNIFLNKDDGTLLSAGVVTFYRDVERTILKPIYQQVRLPDNTYDFVPLNNPVTLTSIGTYGSNTGEDINVYLYPYTGSPTDSEPGEIDLYYITVYSSDGILELTREAWPPNVASISNVDSFSDSENQIENPQFIITFLPFTNTEIYTVSGSNTETLIAPNWSIITNGTGTVTVTQENNNDITMPSGAPFALVLSSAGITSLQLRQRFLNSPRLFQNSYVSASLVAKSFLANEVLLSMDYVPDSGTSYNLMTGTVTSDGSYTTLLGQTILIESTNATGGQTGYVDIIINIPILAQVGITSVQVLTVKDAEDSSEFQQISTLRQTDHLFNFYKNPLLYKPIPSWLVGWDFPLNPAQIFGNTIVASAIGGNKSFYAWDQTIVFQSADSGIGVTRESSGAIVLTAAATCQTALVQYLDPQTTRDILHNQLCVYVEHNTIMPTPVMATVSLWYTTDTMLPNVAPSTNNSLILTLDANGKPATFNGNWTEIPRGNFGNAIFQITGAATNTYNNSSFAGWSIVGNAAVDTATYFAIVIGTGSVTMGNNVSFLSAALMSGQVATRPGSQSKAQVLKDCEYYYEKSYQDPSVAASVDGQNALIRNQFSSVDGGGNQTLQTVPFDISFRTPKIKTPNFNLYSPASGLGDTVVGSLYNNATLLFSNDLALSANWTVTALGTKNVYYLPKNITKFLSTGGASSSALPQSTLTFHYVCDARLGIVL